MSSSLRSIQVILALALTLGVNAVADLLPLNGRTTAEISDAFHICVTPAGYTFLIWTFIYAGLIAYATFQSLSSHRSSRRLQAIRSPFLVSCAANMGWLWLWHYEYFAASFTAMLILLASLAVIYDRLHDMPAHSEAECWMVDRVFSLYVAWISVATLVDLSVVLDFLHLHPFGMDAANWAVVVIGIATGIAATVGLTRRDRVFLLVFLWAFVGIASVPDQLHPVQITAYSAAAVVLGLIGWITLSPVTRRLHA